MIFKIKGVRKEDKTFYQLVVEQCNDEKARKQIRIRLTTDEMMMVLSRLQLKRQKELIGNKIFMSEGKIYIMGNLTGEISGDTERDIKVQVLSLNGENGQCVFRIGNPKENKSNFVVEVRTNDEVLNYIKRMLDCIFPWKLQGMPAIYAEQKVYVLLRIN